MSDGEAVVGRDSVFLPRAPREALECRAQARVALRAGERPQFRRGGAGNLRRRSSDRLGYGGRWRTDDDAKLRGRARPFGGRGDRREQFCLAEPELGREGLVFDEQPEFGVGMANDMTVARERRRKQSADAPLQRREMTGASQYAREPARVATASAVVREQFLRADGLSRATIPPRATDQ